MPWFWPQSKSSTDRRAQRHHQRDIVRRSLSSNGLEQLQSRQTMSADPLPVLMVIADQQDFYYREYSDTRDSLLSQGLDVVVSASTTNTSYAHPNTGQSDGVGGVTPDIALSDVNVHNYSAIVFVGGWGSSMYQYAYNDPNQDGVQDNFYAHGHYNGDNNNKLIVNNLIGQFIANDKHVGAICHGVTVLAWARVDGVSPLQGRHVAVPTTVGSPDQFYNGALQSGGYQTGQYDQVIANGGLARPVSRYLGNPHTAADDVVVDGQIITAENYDSASHFGLVIAREVIAATAANAGSAVLVGNDLVLTGTNANDIIYVWSGRAGEVQAWMNGIPTASMQLGPGGRVIVFAGHGDDQVFASDLYAPTVIYGQAGNDLITGGHGHDVIEGGDGVDRISGNGGNDILRGGNGNDFLYGGAGDNVLIGDSGHDYLEGGSGFDLLIGGMGADVMRGASNQDVMIGGLTNFDHQDVALQTLMSHWSGAANFAGRVAALTNPLAPVFLQNNQTVWDDTATDIVLGGSHEDLYFVGQNDTLYTDLGDQLL